jgi:hypothetical protein
MVNVVGHMNVARSDMLVHASFALLPVARPKPGLVGGNRHVRTEFDDTIIALNNLDLRPWLVEMEASPYLGRQDDFAPSAHPHERPPAHVWQYSGITALPPPS